MIHSVDSKLLSPLSKQDEKEVMTSEQLAAIETETKTKKEELMALKLERKRDQSGEKSNGLSSTISKVERGRA